MGGPADPRPAEGAPGDLDRLAAFRAPTGRFEVREEIGRGGMGEVHGVWDAALQRLVARKTLHRPAGGGPLDRDRLLRFLAEARVTGGLEHPGVVPVHDLGVDDEGAVFFTMRRVQGRDLEEVYELERRGAEGWTRARVLGVLQRVCEAMAYAHSQGVVHRDLKPANVMVGSFGEVYVVDWGIARVRGRPGPDAEVPSASATAAAAAPQLTQDGAVIGTPQFMSPEQADGRTDEIDERTDVYAVGAMLYELLAGHGPFGDRYVRSLVDLLRLVRTEDPTPLTARRGVPPELAAICGKAMARDRARRYPDMQALAEDLRAFLEDRVVRAHRTGALVELRKWVRRNRLAAGALGTALLAMVIGTAVAVAGERAATERKLEFDQLATVREHAALASREARLHPAWPAAVDALGAWLAEADALLARAPGLRRVVDNLARLEELTPGQEILRSNLVALLPELDAFAATRSAVQQRLAWARRVRDLTLRHPRARHGWDEVRAALAAADGEVASELYAGQSMPLDAMWGLVPIGRNPATGFWEFYHLRSAWDGRSDPADLEIPGHRADGSIEVRGDTGIVFVLLPGAEFTMGAGEADLAVVPGGRIGDDELPQVTVRLGPFLLARHELTQGQWARLWDGDPDRSWPAWHRSGTQQSHPGFDERFGPGHPVEQVSWHDAQGLLARHGLTLPSEAQWEYGARAGSATAWYVGDRPELLAGHANLLDLRAVQAQPDLRQGELLEAVDGFVGTAPVGSLAANPFGLHDVYGNVAEWCLDSYGRYGREQPGSGLRPDAGSNAERVNRGGTIIHPPLQVRSAMRFRISPGTGLSVLGLRPARLLRPAGS